MEDNDFERIHFIDDCKKEFVSPKKFLNKYTPYSYFQQNIKDKSLVFVSPETWRDPFERLYYNATGYEKYGLVERPNFYCMCLTENSSENEDAAWTMYSKNANEKIVKITYNASELLKCLNSICIKNNYDVYIGKVNYDFSSAQISGLSKNTKNNKEKEFFEKCFWHFPMENEDFFCLMLLKRKAFQFEREVRLFLIPHEDTKEKGIFELKGINYTDDLISKITLVPLQPFDFNDQRKAIYNKLQGTEEKLFKDEIIKLLPGFPSKKIQQSGLYKEQKRKTIL